MIFAYEILKLMLVISAMMVITATNAVHSILFLVLAFATASATLFLLEAEFIAIVLLVVYVGAVAVLFLFVVNDVRNSVR